MRISLTILVLATFFSCQSDKTSEYLPDQLTLGSYRLETPEDAMDLLAAYERQATITSEVPATLETAAIRAADGEDAADDPALWIKRSDKQASVIYGSNKRGGIAAYNLNGAEIAYYPVGNINNIDVTYGFELNGNQIDLLGGSNRSDQSIDLFRIDPENGALTNISARPFLMDSTRMDDIYGFCFYRSPDNDRTYAIANAKNGRVLQYQLIPTADSLIDLVQVREIKFESQVEGMVADALYQTLYVGEENRGIWRLSAEPKANSERYLLPNSDSTNTNISYDVEGLTIYEQGTAGYLIASSQGNFSYAVFDRANGNPYLFSFKIGGSNGIDGTEETDGIEATSDSLSPQFPKGVFIAQDGFNFLDTVSAPQNFKLVDWQKIQQLPNEVKD